PAGEDRRTGPILAPREHLPPVRLAPAAKQRPAVLVRLPDRRRRRLPEAVANRRQPLLRPRQDMGVGRLPQRLPPRLRHRHPRWLLERGQPLRAKRSPDHRRAHHEERHLLMLHDATITMLTDALIRTEAVADQLGWNN